ncbi:MAG: translation initiation factor IF-5A, partial [Nanoarchaeota archaeon]|nr:translation initiation factor IF-5A [Nanoarchaeota archaeon]
AVGIVDEKKRIVVMPGHDNVEVPIIEKKSAQVLSIQGDTANVMDSETYETFDLKIPEELKDEVVEGVNVMYWVILDDKVMKQVKS